MENFLPGIKSIEYAISEMIEITHFEKLAKGIPISVQGTFTSICIEGLASVEYETKKVSGQDIYTTKLIFRHGKQKIFPWSLEDILLKKRLVYRLTDVTGKQFLLGLNESPYPEALVKDTNQSTPNGTNISEFEITYTNLFPYLEIA